MAYPKMPDLRGLVSELELRVQLKAEHASRGIAPVLRGAERALRASLRELKRLPPDARLARREPDGFAAIRALRPPGPRRLWSAFDRTVYRERLKGALLGRFAGCTLGSPVEFWDIERMERLARENGQAFPPTGYWKRVPDPDGKRYNLSRRESYTAGGMDGVPVDDDLAYTLLGLLIVEEHGPGFMVGDVGKAWLKYLPVACTAEKVALENLKRGVPARKAADRENPYIEWIGAWIRSDPWGYLAAGWPERAAELAYRDAFISHRRQGIYGEMFFAAAIAAAFAADDPLDAIRAGLTEIPRECALAEAIRWALKVAPAAKDHRRAREMMEAEFRGMARAHTINNACLVVWGLAIGGRDFTRVIGETVAMGMDNDCTAATAGSICGAVVGGHGIPAAWTRRFNNTVHSYLIGRPRFTITGLIERFTRQAERMWKG